MNYPGVIQPQQKIYSQRTHAQRQIFIQDLLMKYPDIMTQEEQKKTNTIKDFMIGGITFGIFAMPYSLYLGMKARRNPANRSSILRKMLILPTLPLAIVLISGAFAEKNFDHLSQKYFSQLSDGDLDNFENYYHMLRSGMPLQPQHIQVPNGYLSPPQQQYQQ